MTEFKSIIELCQDAGCVPFFVRRSSWSEYSNYKVTKVEISDWPYGKAWGEFYGIFLSRLCIQPTCEIPHALCKDWYIVDVDESKYDKEWYAQVQYQTKKSKH